MGTLRFPGLQIESAPESTLDAGVTSDTGADDESSFHLLTGSKIILALPERPAEYYRHGWQSWSLTCWQTIGSMVPAQRPALLRPLETDPAYAKRRDPTGSWVGAVRFVDDSVLLLGALGTDARVAYAGGALRGRSDAGDAGLVWFVSYGTEQEVFDGYARALGEHFGAAPRAQAPTIWCSWYSLYTAISEDVIGAILPGLGTLPVNVIQIDDGWQVGIGDWTPNVKFPSGMAALASRIRETGRSAGLWLAPLIVSASSTIAQGRTDWLLRDRSGRPVSAGINWGEQLYAIDTTHPDAAEWLGSLIRTVREWGFDYLKLDFLYAGALPGTRHGDLPREAAYRNALRTIREAAGDAYLVTCGAPIIPSLGLCDAIRIGPDVAGFWSSNRDERLLRNPTIPGTRNAIRTSVHRLWLKSIITADPDVFYLSERWNSLTAEQKTMQTTITP